MFHVKIAGSTVYHWILPVTMGKINNFQACKGEMHPQQTLLYLSGALLHIHTL